MKLLNKINIYLFCFLLITSLYACGRQRPPYENPPGYALDQPEKFLLPVSLLEVSGLAFNEKQPDLLYGIEDEEGVLYAIRLEEKETEEIKFRKSGDYEDLSFHHQTAYVLRSDGVIYSFQLNSETDDVSDEVEKYEDLLPKGEYEGMFINDNNQLFVLSKESKKVSDRDLGVYVFQIKDNDISAEDDFTIDLSEFHAKIKNSKKFRPSGLTQNKTTGEWFVISAINNTLIVTDSDWKVKEVYALDPTIFRQPEGIAFDVENNLYISNEGDDFSNGNVLKFAYQSNLAK